MKVSRGVRRLISNWVGLVAKGMAPEALGLSASLERALRRRGVEVFLEQETAVALGQEGGVRRDRIARAGSLVMVLGGDGTLLSVAREAPSSARILGVNIGALGFLAGRFREERRRRLEVRVFEGTLAGPLRALNDAVLSKEAIARISTFSIAIG